MLTQTSSDPYCVSAGDAPSLRYQAALVGSLACIETLTLQHGRVMSSDACREFRRAYLTYRCALNFLAESNLAMRRCRYHLRPKIHQLGHIACDLLPFNPRRCANFLDEDFICKVKELAVQCHPLHMPLHVAMRYSINACLRWHNKPLA